MKCCHCGKEILSNNNDESYSFYGGLGNKKLEEEKQNYERKISKKKNTILDMITVKEDD